MSRKYLMFHIKFFREGYVQHLNNIFEYENKQPKKCCGEFKKKILSSLARPGLGPNLPHSGIFELSALP